MRGRRLGVQEIRVFSGQAWGDVTQILDHIFFVFFNYLKGDMLTCCWQRDLEGQSGKRKCKHDIVHENDNIFSINREISYIIYLGFQKHIILTSTAKNTNFPSIYMHLGHAMIPKFTFHTIPTFFRSIRIRHMAR